LRLTCSSLSLYTVPPDEAISTIAELGFRAMDLVGIPSLEPTHLDVARRDPAELERLAQAIQRSGMELASVVTVPSDGLERWDADEINARVAWAVRACQAAGAKRLVLDAGNPIPGESVERAEALARWKAMITEAIKLTRQAGVALTVEAPHTGTLAEKFDQVEELLNVMDLPAVGLDYDTSHVYRSGTSTADSWRLVGGRVVKVALRDVGQDGEFCRPGSGCVDFPSLFRLLRTSGYRGDMVIELETPGITEAADQRSEIELTRTFVQETLAGL
jgi:sugar phosphate isomerase/epimerase